MLLEIDHHSGVPIYRQVIEQIRQEIIAGLLHADEQLPSVRDIALELRVNPMTVSKAYSLLEMDGLLERRRGVGLFVKKLRHSEKEQSKYEMLSKILKRAAVRAVQFDISEEQMHELLSKQYRQYHSKVWR